MAVNLNPQSCIKCIALFIYLRTFNDTCRIIKPHVTYKGLTHMVSYACIHSVHVVHVRWHIMGITLLINFVVLYFYSEGNIVSSTLWHTVSVYYSITGFTWIVVTHFAFSGNSVSEGQDGRSDHVTSKDHMYIGLVLL